MEEYSNINEYRTEPLEISIPKAEITEPGTFHLTEKSEKLREQALKKEKAHRSKAIKAAFMQGSAVMASVLMINSSFGRDTLNENPFANASSEGMESISPNNSIPADYSNILYTQNGVYDSFVRNNYYPDTELGEAWVRLDFDDITYYKYAGEKIKSFGVTITTELPEVYYNKDENILYLNDVSLDRLNINMMGNGFKICIQGDCEIGSIVCWGYHYGGSLEICGNGNLTINKDNKYSIGIQMNAESSDSALLISAYGNVNIYGSDNAIYVNDTLNNYGFIIPDDAKVNDIALSIIQCATPEKGIYFVDSDTREYTKLIEYTR